MSELHGFVSPLPFRLKALVITPTPPQVRHFLRPALKEPSTSSNFQPPFSLAFSSLMIALHFLFLALTLVFSFL